MATVKGHYSFCADGNIAFSFECTGKSCYALEGFADTTCTNNADGSSVTCANDNTCDGPPIYTSDINIVQSGSSISFNDNNSFPGADTGNSTASGTQTAPGSSQSAKSTGPAAPHYPSSSVSGLPHGPTSTPSGPARPVPTVSSANRAMPASNFKWLFGMMLLLAMFTSVSAIAEPMSPAPGPFDPEVRSHPDLIAREVDAIISSLNARDIQWFCKSREDCIKELIVKIAGKIMKNIYKDKPPAKCSISLSPEKPWFIDLYQSCLNGLCAAEGFALSFVKPIKPRLLDLAEKTCTARGLAFVTNMAIELALPSEGVSLALGLATAVLIEVICKTAIALVTDDKFSVEKKYTDICQSMVKLDGWPEITSDDGLPCSDPGLPVTTGIKPATVPPGILPTSTSALNSRPTFDPKPPVLSFNWESIAKYPCTTCAFAVLVDAGASGNPLPVGYRLAEAFCGDGNGENTSDLCNTVCKNPCQQYSRDGLTQFFAKYGTPDYYRANCQSCPADFGSYLRGECESIKGGGGGCST